MEVREISSYCTLVLLVLILFTDCALVVRFRNYYRCHGYGVVTWVLLNLVATQLLATFLFVAMAVLILTSDDISSDVNTSYVGLLKDGGTAWLMSATLVHVLVLTCLRIYSVSYGNRFLKFVGSTFNVRLVLIKLWFVSLSIAVVTITSPTPTTCSVFYVGILATGSFAVIAFFCTADSNNNNNNAGGLVRSSMSNSEQTIPMGENIDGVQNPRKTYTMFTGVLVSFAVFVVPTCVPHLYYTTQKTSLDFDISLLLSLWCAVGVWVNALWIWFRMRCKMNLVDGLYSKWTLEQHDNDSSDLPKRHSFRSCDVIDGCDVIGSGDVIEKQYASIASLEEQVKQMRKEIT